MTRLSVIIPTRDRAAMLGDCLASLARQTVDPRAIEVLVVDDGSSDATPEVVTRFAGERFTLRCARQEPSGLNVARNTGARLARGDLIAYLDDDTIVDPTWAEAMIEAFGSTGCDAVAGRIVLRLEGRRPGWLTPAMETLLSALDLGSEAREIAAPAGPLGANCAVTRDAFERAGGFGAGLDREGTSLLSNGDIEFFARVRASGGKTMWWPAASALHRVPPERLTRAWFRRRMWWQGVSDGTVGRQTGTRLTATVFTREIARAGRALPILAAGLARGRGGLSASLWVRYCAGRIAGLRGARDRGAPFCAARGGLP